MNTLPAPCLICGAPTKTVDAAGKPPKYLPFCSSRCQTIDLGNWLGERYVVPVGPAIDAEPTSSASGDDEPGGKDPTQRGDLGG